MRLPPGTLNFLEESSNSCLSLDSYSFDWPVSYLWEVSIANPILALFTNISMPIIDVMDVSELDPAPSSDPAGSDRKGSLGTH